MKDYQYEIIKSNVKYTSEAIKEKNIFYKCLKCGDIIPSLPKDNIGCKCHNIEIDKDLNRLFIEDYQYFGVVKRLRS